MKKTVKILITFFSFPIKTFLTKFLTSALETLINMDTLVCDSYSIYTIFCVVDDKGWDSNFMENEKNYQNINSFFFLFP